MMNAVEEVKAFAASAHRGQQRKYTPEPYIVHPVRVMNICEAYSQSVPLLCAALLHDVLEDTEVTANEMRNFLRSVMSEADAVHTAELVQELTDVYTKENYPGWNRGQRKTKEADRIEKTSAEAQTIKYADIIDNCREIVQYDREFGPRFLKECHMLLQRMTKGNTELYGKAKETVRNEMSRLPAPMRKP